MIGNVTYDETWVVSSIKKLDDRGNGNVVVAVVSGSDGKNGNRNIPSEWLWPYYASNDVAKLVKNRHRIDY